MILAGDVGGTKTNLAQFDSGGDALGGPRYEETLYGARYPSFLALLEDYRSRHPSRLEAACFGVAGPVVDDRVRITHLGWEIDTTTVARTLGLKRVHLINDLVATGFGIQSLEPAELADLQAGIPSEHGNAGLLAAGTGLGESILVRVDGRYLPVPSESGHADFAPRTDAELRVFHSLRARHGRVSYERVLSGPGLASIGELMHEERGASETWRRHVANTPGGGAEAVSRLGIEQSCPACVDSLRLFVGVYGAEAGNVALRALARGGVYIGGGIAPKILPALREGTFMEAFRDKEHLRPLLSTIPVRVILNERAAVLGAARYAAFAGS